MDFKTIGESLTTEEFNAFVTLIRQNNTVIRRFGITENIINSEYFTLEFDFNNITILNNGILITDKTKANPPHVELTNNTFKHSTYTLNLKVLDRENYNIYTRDNGNAVYETLSIILSENEETVFDLSSLENGLIILFDDANVTITHDKPTIKIIEEEP